MIRANLNGKWFTAVPATDECTGCAFEGERTSVCRAACEEALASSLPDCESQPHLNNPGYIYVLDKSEGRQMDLLDQV